MINKVTTVSNFIRHPSILFIKNISVTARRRCFKSSRSVTTENGPSQSGIVSSVLFSIMSNGVFAEMDLALCL